MSVIIKPFALKTPRGDGEVLVVPALRSIAAMVASNRAKSAKYSFALCDVPYGQYRQAVRADHDLPADRSVIAMGHQPEFHHCGVWAKSAICQTIIESIEGTGVTVMIDHDKIRSHHFQVPYAEAGRVRLAHIPIQEKQIASVYEQLPAWKSSELKRFSDSFDEVPGTSDRPSMMSVLLDGFGRARAPRDWVSQYIFATKAVDRTFGISLRYLRASQIDYGCFFADLIKDARRFAASYNKALWAYRLENRIKGSRHPIPDLHIGSDRVELPMWIADSDGVRRRLHVGESNGGIYFYADGQLLETYRASDFASWSRAQAHIDELNAAHALRPRALTFTMWARLFLCDFFIHGIGGAKYDQIADLIIQDYFGVAPPQFCCVSATQWLGFPRYQVAPDDLMRLRNRLRDARHNPQRYAAETGDSRDLIMRRQELISKSLRLRKEAPREHDARMQTFQEIRSINQKLGEFCESQFLDARERYSILDWQLKSNLLANSREHFYCLFSKQQLTALREKLLETA